MSARTWSRILIDDLKLRCLQVIFIELLFTDSERCAAYSESLKLSVDAKIALSQVIFTEIPASVGRIFPSAEEKRVLSIDFFTTEPLSKREVSSLIEGIRGKSFAGNHLIFNFPLEVLIIILSFPHSSMSTLSSFISAI